jgi:hypothetical protein
LVFISYLPYTTNLQYSAGGVKYIIPFNWVENGLSHPQFNASAHSKTFEKTSEIRAQLQRQTTDKPRQTRKLISTVELGYPEGVRSYSPGCHATACDKVLKQADGKKLMKVPSKILGPLKVTKAYLRLIKTLSPSGVFFQFQGIPRRSKAFFRKKRLFIFYENAPALNPKSTRPPALASFSFRISRI